MQTISAATILQPQFPPLSVPEEKFLGLFPHRFDYIYAPHPDPGTPPLWQTESRHPLSDRLIQQGSHLFGVRFGTETNYCLLDIDRGSAYHPENDPLAIGRILAALEPIGLVASVGCTSSSSGGLHLYFPFTATQPSWECGSVLATLLENAGFKLKPGQLETFPNRRPYNPHYGLPSEQLEGDSLEPTRLSNPISLFNAHRLPMQLGSYLINKDFEPIWSDRSTFLEHWQFAEAKNQLDIKTIKRILKQAQPKVNPVRHKADKFLRDLNSEIEVGWTDYGQTNYLLGRITMRTYIFHHVLHGGEPLVGEALVQEIIRIAHSLPGYTTYCQHQHEIQQRAEEWARCIENSHYFPYGTHPNQHSSKQQLNPNTRSTNQRLTETDQENRDQNNIERVNWNDQQSTLTRQKIQSAIADMLETDRLPSGTTDRFKALLNYGIGGASLYKHRDLWHPNNLQQTLENNLTEPSNQGLTQVINRSADEAIDKSVNQARNEASPELPHSQVNLFPELDGNSLLSPTSSRFNSVFDLFDGGNSLLVWFLQLRALIRLIVRLGWSPRPAGTPTLKNKQQIDCRQVVMEKATFGAGCFWRVEVAFRQVIFYHTSEQEQLARRSRQHLQQSAQYDKPIVTQIQSALEYWLAEEYHQQYLIKQSLKLKHSS